MAELFYFNNQIEVQDSCLLHSWYLSTDIQLYIASFFIIIALYKKPKLGILLCLFSIVGGIATQAYFINHYNTGMSWSLSSPDIFKTIRETRVLHFAVWNYISSYAIGLLLGFVITKKIEVNDSQFRLGWAVVFAIGSAAVYGHYMLLQEGASRNQEILVGATMRTAIAICGAWWFYNIWLDRIPLQSRIANASIWLYLGRINYSTFMLHFLFVWYNNFSLRATIEYRGFPILMRLISELVISHFLGYLGYIVFEAPCLNITKALFTRKAAVVPKGDTTDVNKNKEAAAKKAN
jgi:peptidoglycan/LPS O-acetylase OafA/YrhL